MSESKDRFKNALGSMTLLTVSTVIALIVAEFGFRFAKQSKWLEQVSEWKHELYEVLPDNPMEYRLRANTSRENTIPQTGATWNYKINSSGYRDDEFDLSDNRSHVVFLGDSFTFGWAVDQQETLTSHVEQWFEKARPDLKLEALNLGVPGYNTILEFHHLKQTIDLYRPKLVVLIYVVNDGEPQRNHHQRPNVRYEYVASWLFAYIKEQINYYVFGGEEKLDTGVNEHSFDYLAAVQTKDPKWEAGREAFADMVALCNEKDVPLIVAVFPDVTSPLDEGYLYGQIHAEVRSWGRENNVRVIDLFDDFEGEEALIYRVEGDGHPNGKAFAKVADRISPVIANSLTENLQ